MSAVKTLFGQFLEIQIGQNNAIREIAGKDIALQFWKNSIELSSHMRDCHGSPWDSSAAVKEHGSIIHELFLLNQQYEQNQKRMEELRKQLFAEVC